MNELGKKLKVECRPGHPAATLAAAKSHLAVSMAPKRCALLAHEHAAAPTSSACSRRLLLLLALCLGAAAGEERRELTSLSGSIGALIGASPPRNTLPVITFAAPPPCGMHQLQS